MKPGTVNDSKDILEGRPAGANGQNGLSDHTPLIFIDRLTLLNTNRGRCLVAPAKADQSESLSHPDTL
jgi:hypothetical protein